MFLQRNKFKNGVIYRVCSLRLGPNFVVQLAVDKKFYLRSTFEKMQAFSVFSNKYLQSYGCSDSNFTATVNCTNLKSQIIKWNHWNTNHWNTNRLVIPLLVTNLFGHSIVIRNEKIVWKHGPNRPFYALMLRTKLY